MKELKRTKTGGRSKGTQNKITKEIKEYFKEIIEFNLPQMQTDILELTPKDRIDIMLKISEFILPKLQRVSGEINTNKDNEIIVIRGNKFGDRFDNNVEIETTKENTRLDYEEEYL